MTLQGDAPPEITKPSGPGVIKALTVAASLESTLQVPGVQDMTQLLDTALAEVAKLPPEEQDVLGTIIPDEIKSEQRWSASFANSQPTLKALADEAIAEFRAGKFEAPPAVRRPGAFA
jgi:hypothetical protein